MNGFNSNGQSLGGNMVFPQNPADMLSMAAYGPTDYSLGAGPGSYGTINPIASYGTLSPASGLMGGGKFGLDGGGSGFADGAGVPSLWDQFSSAPWFNKPDKNGGTEQGKFAPMLGAAQGIFNGWLGMQQLGHARNQLNEGKQQFALNYDAQRTTTNAQLEDRQRARVASGSGYQSVGDYMAQNGIKPRGG